MCVPWGAICCSSFSIHHTAASSSSSEKELEVLNKQISLLIQLHKYTSVVIREFDDMSRDVGKIDF